MRTDRFQNFMKRLSGPGLSADRITNRFTNEAANERGFCVLRGQVKNEGSDTVEILFHDYIGDSWTGSDSLTIAKLVRENRGKKIKCDINSFGGSAYDGISIYNALAAHDAEVLVEISGIAYSAASIIALAGDKIRIAENGTYGIHPAAIGIYGNQYDLDHYGDWLKSLDTGILDTYVARSGKEIDQVRAWFVGKNNDGSFFNGKEAVEYGFADELIPLKKKSDGDESATENSGSRLAPESVRERIRQVSSQIAEAAAKQRRERVQQLLSRR